MPTLCLPLKDASGSRVTTPQSTAAEALAGELVLLHQVTDAGFPISTGAPTAPADVGFAGTWQVVRVVSVANSGNEDRLDVAPDVTYDFSSSSVSRRAQLCTFPHFTSLDVQSGGQIAAAAWDGQSGGILAFRADHLNVSGTMTMSQVGFRGGLAAAGSSTCDGPAEPATNADAGGKGEGADGRAHALFGISHRVHSGGGGGSAGAGGGGGGGAAPGGNGGNQTPTCVGPIPENGNGGVAISIPFVGNAGLFFGGAGGAGQNSPTSHGGTGGGIVFVVTSSLSGAGSILANGQDGGSTSGAVNGHGGGGGGGGGSVVLSSRISTFGGIVSVTGGNGGSSSPANGGAGGGGGGGFNIRYGGAAAAASVITGGGSTGGSGLAGGGGGSSGTSSAALPLDVPMP